MPESSKEFRNLHYRDALAAMALNLYSYDEILKTINSSSVHLMAFYRTTTDEQFKNMIERHIVDSAGLVFSEPNENPFPEDFLVECVISAKSKSVRDTARKLLERNDNIFRS